MKAQIVTIQQVELFTEAELESLEFVPEELEAIEQERVPNLESISYKDIAEDLEAISSFLEDTAEALALESGGRRPSNPFDTPNLDPRSGLSSLTNTVTGGSEERGRRSRSRTRERVGRTLHTMRSISSLGSSRSRPPALPLRIGVTRDFTRRTSGSPSPSPRRLRRRGISPTTAALAAAQSASLAAAGRASVGSAVSSSSQAAAVSAARAAMRRSVSSSSVGRAPVRRSSSSSSSSQRSSLSQRSSNAAQTPLRPRPQTRPAARASSPQGYRVTSMLPPPRGTTPPPVPPRRPGL